MKKQSGFTLIELMVVMAIIAILATAGLSAYTGYIKKARDTTRIADVAAINTIIMATMTSTGLAPAIADVNNAVKAANNGVMLVDPRGTDAACLTSNTVDTAIACEYVYQKCDSDLGFSVGARLESKSNQAMLLNDGVGLSGVGLAYYEIGSCKAYNGAFTALATS